MGALSETLCTFSYDCEPGFAQNHGRGDKLGTNGHTYLLSMCLTPATQAGQRCSSYWFLMPENNSHLDVNKPDHQVRDFQTFATEALKGFKNRNVRGADINVKSKC